MPAIAPQASELSLATEPLEKEAWPAQQRVGGERHPFEAIFAF